MTSFVIARVYARTKRKSNPFKASALHLSWGKKRMHLRAPSSTTTFCGLSDVVHEREMNRGRSVELLLTNKDLCMRCRNSIINRLMPLLSFFADQGR